MTPLDVATFAGNVITAALLAAAGIAALSMARTGRDPGRQPRPMLPRRVACVFGAGLLALALDELLDLHERAGSWLSDRGVEAPGPVNHVDDLVLLAYVAAGAVALAFAIPSLVPTPRLFASILMAGALFAIAAALDALATPGSWNDAVEEALEAVAAATLAFSFVRARAPKSGTGRPRRGQDLASITPSLRQSRG